MHTHMESYTRPFVHLSLSIMCSRLVHVGMYLSTSSLFMAEYYSIVRIDHSSFIHWVMDIFLDIMNNAEYPSDIMNDVAMRISHRSTHMPPFFGST